MLVFVAVIQENEYETTPFNIGVFSTIEKAEEEILEWIRENDSYAPSLSRETYNTQDEPRWLWFIEAWEVE